MRNFIQSRNSHDWLLKGLKLVQWAQKFSAPAHANARGFPPDSAPLSITFFATSGDSNSTTAPPANGCPGFGSIHPIIVGNAFLNSKHRRWGRTEKCESACAGLRQIWWPCVGVISSHTNKSPNNWAQACETAWFSLSRCPAMGPQKIWVGLSWPESARGGGDRWCLLTAASVAGLGQSVAITERIMSSLFLFCCPGARSFGAAGDPKQTSAQKVELPDKRIFAKPWVRIRRQLLADLGPQFQL